MVNLHGGHTWTYIFEKPLAKHLIYTYAPRLPPLARFCAMALILSLSGVCSDVFQTSHRTTDRNSSPRFVVKGKSEAFGGLLKNGLFTICLLLELLFSLA
jgi:hypothetical protein